MRRESVGISVDLSLTRCRACKVRAQIGEHFHVPGLKKRKADDLILFINQNDAMRVAADRVLNDAVVARRNEDHFNGPEHLKRGTGYLTFFVMIMEW